ncbi:MAG: SDR family NAD(P)-dependent oxidoreductase [Fuerstiella sp.]|nr:SDR family NAD(P)-dependent oxidoreductase [Fuerstiella sp.]
MTTVVITGVSRGLGRAMSMGFAEAGCTVVGCSRSMAELVDLRNALGEPHRFDVVDVVSDAAVAAWSQEVLSLYGAPDFLVNNAAVINHNASLWEIPAEQFDGLTAVNINGTANTIRHYLPAMIEQRSGVIVNFSSGWGRAVSAQVAPYCASKWAIEGLTRALAEELPAGMATVPLNPGVINTDMLQSCFGSGAEFYTSAAEWAKQAVPFILQITAADSGRPLTVPE